MARTILGIFIGTLLAGLVLAACGYGFTELYRLPGTADFATRQSLADYAAATPDSAIACVLAAWALAALAGGWVAAMVAKPRPDAAALAVGALLTATVIVYAAVIPNPDWMTVVGVLLPIPCAVVAALLAMPRIRSVMPAQAAAW